MSMNHNQTEVESILKEELDCFKNILLETKEVIKQKESFFKNSVTLDRMEILLESRERWIELLKRLEEQKEKFAFSQIDFYNTRKEISKIAHTLVEIDAKILDILQIKKIETIKEITKLVDNSSRNTNSNRYTSVPRLIDIKQE